ncbi:CPBP family intramembrane glutamic endopeptidase [Ornithinimicrobium sp. Y1847]|uniref:CPBP family intramembrane glutamic endopeptidase n=1 Tax=unclassified Ornithinimicrobium TaxID=2615080 RepID=UPI003B66EDDC
MTAPAPTPSRARTPARPRRTYARPVTHADAALTVGSFLLATGLGLGLVTALLFSGFEPDAAVAGGIPTTIVLWFLALWYSLRGRGWTWGDIGLGRGGPPAGRWLWQVGLAYLVMMTLTVLIGSQFLTPDAAQQDNVMAAGISFGPVALLALGLAVVVVGPLVEEVVFRRIILGWLESRVGFVVALLVQAALFAVMHIIPQVMILTFFLGIVAGLLARLHRSLWPALALHCLNNAIAVTVMMATLS